MLGAGTSLVLATALLGGAGLAVLALHLRRGGADAAVAKFCRNRRDLVWTLLPILVFAALAVPSLRLIHLRNNPPDADVTIRMTGQMWSWTFEYPDHGLRFVAAMLPGPPAGDDPSAETLPPGHLVVPAGKTVRIYAVGTNLITSWSIADLGISVQTVPGRVQQTWFRTVREGRYLGVCLEVCALPRTFAPILLEVVSEERFARWVAEKRSRVASGASSAPLRVARDTR